MVRRTAVLLGAAAFLFVRPDGPPVAASPTPMNKPEVRVKRVTLTIEQFMANTPVKVWAVSRPYPDGGFELARHGRIVATVVTDAAGQVTFTIDRPREGVVAADYNGDGVFTPQLDALTVLGE